MGDNYTRYSRTNKIHIILYSILNISSINALQPDGPLVKFPKFPDILCTSNVLPLIILSVTVRCIDDTPEPNTAESSCSQQSLIEWNFSKQDPL